MSIKTKITSLITTFILLCSLLTVGVFAVKNTTFNVGGDIVFNVQGIEAEVKLEALNNGSLIAPQTYNTGAETDKLKTFELDNDMTEAQVNACYESWAGLDMKFDSEADVLLKIRITNKTQVANNNLKVDMAATFGNANNATISVDKATATINPGEYEIFTITFSITNKEYSANIDNFSVNVDMAQALPQLSDVVVHHDEENNYYYIEMGTYNGNPVRWRYVSDVTNGIDTAVRFDPTTSTPQAYVGKKGMFILESVIHTTDEIEQGKNACTVYLSAELYSGDYHTTIGDAADVNRPANDYAASDLRAFLNGIGNITNQSIGDLMDVIGIDDTNEIYQKIQGRTLGDLYSNICGTTTASGGSPSNGYGKYLVDKFWALSANEAYRILGGNSISGNEIIWENQTFIDWRNSIGESSISGRYYLRAAGGEDSMWCEEGRICISAVIETAAPIRPAFILEF